MVLNVHRTIRLIRDGEKGGLGGRGYGGGGRLYTCCYTVTTRMIPALRLAAVRAILMFQKEEFTNEHRPPPFHPLPPPPPTPSFLSLIFGLAPVSDPSWSNARPSWHQVPRLRKGGCPHAVIH